MEALRKTVELRARRGVASTCKGAYMDVRNRAGAQLQRCIATQMRRFSFRIRTLNRRSRNSTESGTKTLRPSQTILPVGNFTPPQRIFLLFHFSLFTFYAVTFLLLLPLFHSYSFLTPLRKIIFYEAENQRKTSYRARPHSPRQSGNDAFPKSF